MKKLTLAILGTLALSSACSSVFANGTITVNGVVTDETCTLRGSGFAEGLKDIKVNVLALPKSTFTPTLQAPHGFHFSLYLTNATGTGVCDAATSKAFKGIHLSAISPADLDATDKTLLVNKAAGASTTNPVFIQITVAESGSVVDLSAPWGTQVTSPVYTLRDEKYVSYVVSPASKTGVVDAQNYTATINYTMHYN